jgi:L-threonylcarbamoyladenylate synthase
VKIITNARFIRIDPKNIDISLIEEAAALLTSGGLVAFPTETVYGLGGDARNPNAVAKIFQAKGRPATDPLIVHIWSMDQLASVAVNVPAQAEVLMRRFWPGPLTLLMQRSNQIAAAVSAGMPTVAVRMPAHPIALALLKTANIPVAAPSANLFSHTSPTTAQHVLDDLDGRIPMILDGGPTTVGLESTIVDLSGDKPRILRPGGLSLDTLREVLPEVEFAPRSTLSVQEAAPAPGMLLKHYSPRAGMWLYDGSDENIRQEMAKAATTFIQSGKRVGVLIADEDQPAFANSNVEMITLGSLNNLEVIASRLFAGMRELDSRGVDVILARSYRAEGIGLALRDRLTRAAEGKIVTIT